MRVRRLLMLAWLITVLTSRLVGEDADTPPIRQGIDRDGFRIAVEIGLPALPAARHDALLALCVAAIPGIQPGMDLAGYVRTTHAARVAEIAAAKQHDDPGASLTGWYEESIFHTTWSGGGFISLHGEHQGFTGGAHGWLNHTVLVLDETTLRPLALDDFIAPADQPEFSRLLTDLWCRQNRLRADERPSARGLFVDELPARLPLITPAGIEVVYPPYEIGPWSTGTVRVVLTREQARPFLRRDPWGQ